MFYFKIFIALCPTGVQPFFQVFWCGLVVTGLANPQTGHGSTPDEIKRQFEMTVF